MNKNYKVERGPDGVYWLSVDPFMHDIMEALELLMKMDISELSEDDQNEINMRILGLKAIYTMMGSLIQEKTLETLRGQHNATVDENSQLH